VVTNVVYILVNTKGRDILEFYILILNIIGLTAMGVDKAKAKTGAWRIPEKTLLAIAAIGGSIGVLAGMYFFRHKTKHILFTFGVPAIIVIQLVVIKMVLGES